MLVGQYRLHNFISGLSYLQRWNQPWKSAKYKVQKNLNNFLRQFEQFWILKWLQVCKDMYGTHISSMEKIKLTKWFQVLEVPFNQYYYNGWLEHISFTMVCILQLVIYLYWWIWYTRVGSRNLLICCFRLLIFYLSLENKKLLALI